MKNRGLYNQSEGSERRSSAAATAEHFADNDVAEGAETKKMSRMVKGHDWTGVEQFSQQLRADGWSVSRVNALVGKATFGLRV
tara:strand:- start:918 stop:1166 length:249 start_codon:yes stop_codon:yes gene_type:complete